METVFKSFRLKLFVVFSLLTVVVSGISLYFVYRIGINGQLEALRKSVMGIASTTALMIDGDEHKSIDPQEKKFTEAHKEIDRLLYDVYENNPDILRYVYTLVPTDNPAVYKFVCDAEYYGKDEMTDKDISEIDYNASNCPELLSKEAMTKSMATQSLYADQYGIWLSGFSPVKDKTGNTVALVCVDMSASKVAEFQRGVKIGTLIIFVVCLLISFVLSLFISSTISLPLMKITEHTKVISGGNFKTKIDIKAKDEIRTLADSFNDMVDRLDHMFFELNEAQAHLKDAYLDTIFRLAVAAEYKDNVTSNHLRRVSVYACLIAEKLALPKEDIDNIKYGSPMHDIGKIGIPDTILLKKDKLTKEEYDIIKGHPEIGYKILKDSDSPYLKTAAIISLNHHENFDGTGYPKGLIGEDIHIYGRVVAVADVFDALTSERPYKKPMPLEETIKIIKEKSGTQFDPRVVEAFLECLDEIKKYLKFTEWTSI